MVEETLEADASHLLKNGRREWMIKALRETEQQTGEQLLPKGVADADLTTLQLKEAYSHVGVSLFVGEAVKGRDGKANPRLRNNRKWLLGVQRSAMGRAMNASAQKFAAMFRRAQRLEQEQARGEGGNNTQQGELEETLNRSLGLSEGVVVDGVKTSHVSGDDGHTNPGLSINNNENDTSFSLSISRIPYPDAVIAHELSTMRRHPDYHAAKAGDSDAAYRLARDLVTDKVITKVRAALGNRKPLVVPVSAIETTGRNKIPVMVARELSRKLGLEMSTEIVQAKRIGRTQMGGLERIFSPVPFNGSVTIDAEYLLVDDAITQGGTFAGLATHIHQGGGRVVGIMALTGKSFSAKIRLTDETLKRLRQIYGNYESAFREATGRGFEQLTGSESRYLVRFKPSSAVRDRIIAQRDERRHQEGRRAGGSRRPRVGNESDEGDNNKNAPSLSETQHEGTSDTSADQSAFDSPPNDSQGRDEAASSSEGQSESPFYVSERTRQIGTQLGLIANEYSQRLANQSLNPYHRARLLEQARKVIELPSNQRGNLVLKNIPSLIENIVNEGKSIVERFVNAKHLPQNVEVTLIGTRAKGAGKFIKINPRNSADIVAHELMHSIERQFPEIRRAAIQFLEYRTQGEQPVYLKDLYPDDGFEDWEITYIDKWEEYGGYAYSGKIYKNELGQYTGTEILSTGIERLRANPIEFFTNDPEFFNFVVTTLQHIKS